MKLIAFLSACVMMIQPMFGSFANITETAGLHTAEKTAKSISVYNPISGKVALSGDSVTNEPALEEYYYESVPLTEAAQRQIYGICEEYDVDYPLILGILSVESNFRTNVSYKNKNGSTDMGIAQINSNYLSHYAEMAQIAQSDFDPYILEHGIRALCGDIRYLLDSYTKEGYEGEMLAIHVLNAYNMGQSGYAKYKESAGTASRYYDQKVLAVVRKLTASGETN